MDPSNPKTFRLQIPLDASGIADFKPDQPVKVVVQHSDGSTQEQVVKLNAQGQGTATFNVAGNADRLRVLVGPGDASPTELIGMQTIGLDVLPRQWVGRKEVALSPVKISAYYWHWWLTWCRTFTVRGRVLCADGSPVPGATVSAYDVDYWWWWSSKQQVGSATTDASGAFEIRFRWCCGWWPWWWWLHRSWHLEPDLAERIMPVLHRQLKLRKFPIPDPRPNLNIFEELLSEGHIAPPRPQPPAPPHMVNALPSLKGRLPQQALALDPSVLETLGKRLKDRLPAIPEAERLHLWPWWPWAPWWDCAPDVIFKVTQNCHDAEAVIVNEGWQNTRWDISTPLNVTLTANDLACCIPHGQGCHEGNCLELTHACGDLVTNIGGNIGAPASPAGYVNPGLASAFGDRPYAGVVPLSGTAECMAGVDYYEFEWSDDNGASWQDMPAAAAGGFTRTYIDFSTTPLPTFTPVPFTATPPTGGRNVFETLQHYENTHPPANWGGMRLWVDNRDLLMNWLTENNFADDTYRLRVKGWNLVGGNLVNPRTLHVCGNAHLDNNIVLTTDNRVAGAGSGHPPSTPSHPCGLGTVHTCTLEPDTDFIAVRINGNAVQACDVVNAHAGGTLEIDFLADDPNGHLAFYTLHATYGENQDIDLLSLPSASLSVLTAAQKGPTYGDARGQGATSPIWNGGAFRLTITNLSQAFPETCCYQLELRAHKRTIVNCDDSLWGHTNYSEYSFMVTV